MAGKPAATVTSTHVCPMVTPGSPPIPHVGGPVSGPGAAGVLIDGKPAALVGDMCTCIGPPDTILQGAPGVLIDGKPLALVGSMTAHGGQITVGAPGVLVGSPSGGASSPTIASLKSNEWYKIDTETETAASEVFQGTSENPLVECITGTDEIVKTDLYTIKSDFVHLQLLDLADDLGELNFMAFMARTFGNKRDPALYSRLYRDLSDRKIENVAIEVTKNRIKGNLAAYNSASNTILVSEQLIQMAIEENDHRGMLLTALMEEYGHYIEDLLRTTLAGKEAGEEKDTDYIDAGAVYAYNYITLDVWNRADFHIADVESPAYSGKLILDLSEIHTPLQSYVNESEQLEAIPLEGEEDHFGAGRVDEIKYPHSVGHQNIEDVLDKKNRGYFETEEVLQIYYGNWLRDFSQIILGTTIRLSDAAQKELKKKHSTNARISQLLEAMPSKMTPEGMVRIIHIAAIKEFEYAIQKEILENDNKQNGTNIVFNPDFKLHEANFNKRYGKLDLSILGIYRPEEHIDNPKLLQDESQLFSYHNGKKEITLYKGKYTSDGTLDSKYSKDIALDIDLEKGLKKYIIEDQGPDYPSVVTYIKGQLAKAMKLGRTPKGMQHFGAALHVLEDYFAHTNFVEVSLIKVADPKVYPWIEYIKETKFRLKTDKLNPAFLKQNETAVVQPPYYAEAGTYFSLAKHIPIVTGLFATDDTAASVLPKLADIVFKVEFDDYTKPVPGQRTCMEVAILEMLTDLSEGQKSDGAKNNATYMGKPVSSWLLLYKDYLNYLDWKAKTIQEGGAGGTLWEWHDRFFKSVGDNLTWFANFAFNLLTHTTNEDIADQQTLITNKNYGTDPTHTQIAKDPPEHHFNPLAGELAKIAIKDVAKQLIHFWNTNEGRQNVLDTAEGYFVHPLKCTWQDSFVKNWAKNNPNKMTRGHSASTVEHAHHQTQKELEKYDDIYKSMLDYFQK